MSGQGRVPSAPRVAITFTSKNEVKLLERSIAIHEQLGVSRFFVFLDENTDDTEEVLSKYGSVSVHYTRMPKAELDVPTWITEILPRHSASMDVRKRVNTYFAAIEARREGIDWIACIDADEVICPAPNGGIKLNLIPEFLASVPSCYDQVLMRNLEVIPTQSEVDNPFFECRYFYRRFPRTEALHRLLAGLAMRTLGPVAAAWFSYLFYKLRFGGKLPRDVRDPLTGRLMPLGYFFGYSNYKPFVRTDRAHLFNHNIHAWVAAEEKPRSIILGNVLHFDMFDWRYLADKFRKRPPALLIKAFHTRYKLAEICRSLEDPAVRKFFEDNLVVPPDVIEDLLECGIALEVGVVRSLAGRVVA